MLTGKTELEEQKKGQGKDLRKAAVSAEVKLQSDIMGSSGAGIIPQLVPPWAKGTTSISDMGVIIGTTQVYCEI